MAGAVNDQALRAYAAAHPETAERIEAVLAEGDPNKRVLLEVAVNEHARKALDEHAG
jgi:hypothetical protein